MTAEKPDDAAAASQKKKKSKRSTGSSTRNKESGMSSSSRISGGGGRRDSDGASGDEKHRRRSRSADRGKQRRDSGIREKKERSNSGGGGESAEAPGRSKEAHKDSRAKHTSSPPKTRKHSKNDGIITTKAESRSRSPARPKSPARTTSLPATAQAPRLPQRTASEASALSSLSSALEGNRNIQDEKMLPDRDNFDEASLGDYKLYTQKKGLNNLNASRSVMGEIPEESLGSFAAFAKKYDEEKLLGLHDDDDGPDVYGQYSSKKEITKQPQQSTNLTDASCSLGALMSPMNQYGSGNKARSKPPMVEESLGSFAMLNPMKQYGGNSSGRPKAPVEDSLGSFAMFQKSHGRENLLGMQDSEMSGFQSDAMLMSLKDNHREPTIPEESMGQIHDLPPKEELLEDSFGGAGSAKPMTKPADINEGEEKEKEFHEIELPKNRVEKLVKRGGVGYKIVVDTPGGHFSQPMKIVVAIEFDEDDSSDESEVGILSVDEVSIDVEEEDPLDNVESILKQAYGNRNSGTKKVSSEASVDEDNDLEESGHLPLSSLDEDNTLHKKERISHMLPHKWKRQKRKSNDGLLGKPKASEEDDSESHSESDDEVGPLAANMNRWKTPRAQVAAGASTPRQPEREKSRHSHSTHSTVSSVTLESALESGLPARNDGNAPHRKPGGVGRGPHGSVTNAALKRSTGVVKAGGTATLLGRASRVTPHNLGTRRGLMLRQKSEASMLSTGTSNTNDSSFVGAESDKPEASFMQLNLTDLGQTEMQTNEGVEQAKLPQQLRSGVEGIEGGDDDEPGTDDAEAIPEGKDPTIAASELLGMKTMLKHIRRVAPKRSKSFDFDREMPKQMWNKMFAKKEDMPGSQYVDNGDSFSNNHDEEEEKIEQGQSTPEAQPKNDQAADEPKAAEASDEKAKGKVGLFSAITSSMSADNNEKKEKKSFWSRTIKSVIPSSSKDATAIESNNAGEANAEGKPEEQTEDTKDDGSEASLELDGIMEELNQSLAHHMDGSGYGEGPMSRSRREFSARHRSARGGDFRKSGNSRNRAVRAQQFHNRSLRDAVDYYTTEQQDDDDDDLPQLDAINEEDEAKKRPRARPRRKAPHRTKSADEGFNRSMARIKSSGVHRTRSTEGSPTRPGRENEKMMHKSFSGVDPEVQQAIRRPARDNNVPGSKPKSRDSQQQGVGRARSSDKGIRGSTKANPRKPVRKRSNGGTDEEPYIGPRGAELPEDATEEQLREILDYH